MANQQEAMDTEFLKSVITHMNEDHADACLCIVRAFSTEKSANTALLRNLDRQSLYFTVSSQVPDNQNKQPLATVDIKIDFPAPLLDESQVRTTLVKMSKQARERLASSS